MTKQFDLWGESPQLHNVFFAVRPDNEVAARVADIADKFVASRDMNAYLQPAERLHVSLVAVREFAGDPPPATIEEAQRGARAVSMAPFTVVFDRITSFGGGRGQRPIVLAGGDGATGLYRLHEALQLALMKAGVKTSRSTSFTPHMTIMYADHVCDVPIAPVSWTVDAIVLIDSLVGQSTHRLMGQWPLR